MAIVEFKIIDSKYQIECPDNEKSKLLDIAKKVNERIKKLQTHFKNCDEKTLLAISCLTLEDELESNKNPDQTIKNLEDNISGDLDKLLNKLDLVAKNIEKY